MKTVNDKNQIWFERTNNVVAIGFTQAFLDGLDQCWHILPANLTRFREKAPLMVVETNDNLISIMSPVTAHFAQWADKAQNFPYMLNENDVVLEMNVTEARKTPGRASTIQVNPFAAQEFMVRAADPQIQWEVNERAGEVAEARAMDMRQLQALRDVPQPPVAPAARRTRNF